METNAIVAVSTALSQQQVSAQAQTLLLRKALDLAASSAMQLIAALPTTVSNNPAHLGNSIDVRA